MELRYLRYFVAVAEFESFSRAAEALHVAQPAVSSQIQTLEGELGVTLFARTKRSVKLTAAGYAFLREAKEILAQVDHAKIVARRASMGETGSLSIGCFGASSSLFLPKVIQDYRHRFPLVQIHVHEMSANQQLEAFERDGIDIGFTRPLPRTHLTRFEQKIVYRDRLFAVLPSCHPLARSESVFLEKLAEEDWVLYRREEAPGIVDLMIRECVKAGFTPRVVSQPRMMNTVLLMVAAGVGVSLVPGCVRSFHQPGVQIIPLRKLSTPIDLVLAHRRGHVSPTVAAFHDLLSEAVPSIREIYESGDLKEALGGECKYLI